MCASSIPKEKMRPEKRTPAEILQREIRLEGRCGISSALLRPRIISMLDKAGVRQACLSFVFLSGPAMARLNYRVLGHRGQTDVITFDLGTERSAVFCSGTTRPVCLEGEIYICPDEVRRNARFYSESFRREILRCAAHGILHLLGHDDATTSQREKMHESENFLLR